MAGFTSWGYEVWVKVSVTHSYLTSLSFLALPLSKEKLLHQVQVLAITHMAIWPAATIER